MKVYKGEQCFVDETQSLRIAGWARKTFYADNVYRVHLPLSGQKSKANLRSFIINEVVWYHWWLSHGNVVFIKKKNILYIALFPIHCFMFHTLSAIPTCFFSAQCNPFGGENIPLSLKSRNNKMSISISTRSKITDIWAQVRGDRSYELDQKSYVTLLYQLLYCAEARISQFS